MNSPSHHPHDRFFKGAFSIRKVMEEFVQEFLPKALSKNIQLKTLEQQKESYLDKSLEEYYSDIVYTASYGESDILVTLLLEHKSNVPPYPWLQLLRYILNVYSAQAKQRDFAGVFQPVVPIIVYHGQKTWKVRPISSYFEHLDEHLRSYIPDFDYLLQDLGKMSQRELLIQEGKLIRSAFLALKLSTITDEQERTRIILQGLVEGQVQQDHINFFRLAFVYLLKLGTSRETIVQTIDDMEAEAKTGIKSVYDQLIEEGKAEGLREGKLMAAFDTFRQGMNMGLGLHDLKKLSGVSEEVALKWHQLLSQNPDASLPKN